MLNFQNSQSRRPTKTIPFFLLLIQKAHGHPMYIIVEERPDSPDALLLLRELDDHLQSLYPPESRHGFSVEKLLTEGVAFFLLRLDGIPAACGGILLVDSGYGEIKRMYVRPAFRGRGFGKAMLHHLADYARERHIPLLRLETGIHQHEAMGMYERFGFVRIPPFGPYTNDPVSLCYEKRIIE